MSLTFFAPLPEIPQLDFSHPAGLKIENGLFEVEGGGCVSCERREPKMKLYVKYVHLSEVFTAISLSNIYQDYTD